MYTVLCIPGILCVHVGTNGIIYVLIVIKVEVSFFFFFFKENATKKYYIESADTCRYPKFAQNLIK